MNIRFFTQLFSHADLFQWTCYQIEQMDQKGVTRWRENNKLDRVGFS